MSALRLVKFAAARPATTVSGAFDPKGLAELSADVAAHVVWMQGQGQRPDDAMRAIGRVDPNASWQDVCRALIVETIIGEDRA